MCVDCVSGGVRKKIAEWIRISNISKQMEMLHI